MQGVGAALITTRLNVVTVVRRTTLVSVNRFNVPFVAGLGILPRFAKMSLSDSGNSSNSANVSSVSSASEGGACG